MPVGQYKGIKECLTPFSDVFDLMEESTTDRATILTNAVKEMDDDTITLSPINYANEASELMKVATTDEERQRIRTASHQRRLFSK